MLRDNLIMLFLFFICMLNLCANECIVAVHELTQQGVLFTISILTLLITVIRSLNQMLKLQMLTLELSLSSDHRPCLCIF